MAAWCALSPDAPGDPGRAGATCDVVPGSGDELFLLASVNPVGRLGVYEM
jgi:hypothetical protein